MQQGIPDSESRIGELEQKLKKQQEKNQHLSRELLEMHTKLDYANQQIESMRHSFSWRFFTPLRFVKNKLSELMEKNVWTHKLKKAVHILRRNGWREFKGTFRRFQNVMRQKREGNESGISIHGSDLSMIGYDSEYQENIDFSGNFTDVKALAFYLPQYHAFPENDKWWGKDFTEWVNVRSGKPSFEGHYQPREPHKDIGYYNLEDINVLKRQAELARQHGIHGFVIYYYWFSGKRLMERPVDQLLRHPEINLPFCLCWANENWTRAWDGKNQDILIGQEYSEQDDLNFIPDMKPYLSDPRYIRIQGKPLIIVYNPGQIPDCRRTFSTWRRTAKETGIGDILIWTCETANNTAASLKILDCVDALAEFPPHNMWLDELEIKGADLHGKKATLYHYGKLAEDRISRMKDEKTEGVPLHHGITLGWDNAARRKNDWVTYCGFSLKALYRWTLAVAEQTRKQFPEEERFCFINAWNEWGEGTYLEPDAKYGYASINTVSKALFHKPFRDDFKVFHPIEGQEFSPIPEQGEASPSIAVQVHMFYLETLEETIENLNRIPYPFDCYISTDSKEKQAYIEKTVKGTCQAAKICVEVFANRGRDVAPFLVQMHDRYKQYKYICHIHSKKTQTDDHGNEWRKYNFRHLFGSESNIRQIIHEFEQNPNLGMILPETYPVLEFQAEWGGNREGTEDLLHRMDLCTDLPQDPIFPVGNMFWVRSEAIKPIFDLNLQQTDFPEEEGQINGTLAHCIERCWVYMLRAEGFTYLKTFNNCLEIRRASNPKRLAIYAHYAAEGSVSAEDLKSIQMIAALTNETVVVSNSPLSPEDMKAIREKGNHITIRQRENKGLDFGAWRDTILSMGQKQIETYDELILCNNSFLPPVFSLENMFADMEEKGKDFWGNTVFPYLEDGSYLHLDHIPEHIQSYWMVFGKKVLKNKTFWDFWENMPNYSSYIDVVANCESRLTELLSKEGLTYEPYIKETRYMSRFLNNYAIPYEKPSSLLLLGSPFIKKKCSQYMSEEERIRLENLKGKMVSR